MSTGSNGSVVVGIAIGLGVLGAAAWLAPAGALVELQRDGLGLAGLGVAMLGVFPLARALRLPAWQARMACGVRGSLRVSLCSVTLGALGVATAALLVGGALTGTTGPILAVVTLGGLALLSVVATPESGSRALMTPVAESADVLGMMPVGGAGQEPEAAERARAA